MNAFARILVAMLVASGCFMAIATLAFAVDSTPAGWASLALACMCALVSTVAVVADMRGTVTSIDDKLEAGVSPVDSPVDGG